MDVSAIQFERFTMYNNEKAGIEYKMTETRERYTEQGALIRDALIVGEKQIFVTARKRNCGKVMFSQTSVCSRGGRGRYVTCIMGWVI